MPTITDKAFMGYVGTVEIFSNCKDPYDWLTCESSTLNFTKNLSDICEQLIPFNTFDIRPKCVAKEHHESDKMVSIKETNSTQPITQTTNSTYPDTSNQMEGSKVLNEYGNFVYDMNLGMYEEYKELNKNCLNVGGIITFSIIDQPKQLTLSCIIIDNDKHCKMLYGSTYVWNDLTNQCVTWVFPTNLTNLTSQTNMNGEDKK